MKNKVFNLDKYLKYQSEKILERVNMFGDKLYLEFGGKLFDDSHAKRILPGFEKDSKLRMLLSIKEKCQIIIAISAKDIASNKKRADHDILYQEEVLRLINSFKKYDLKVAGVVITKYQDIPAVNKFIQKLNNLEIKSYLHYFIDSYPQDVSRIVSEEGFLKNQYVEVDSEVVVVTAPGPGSGKMAVCLSQLYHENLRNIKAGYAKFETFPVHDLALNDPINIAYEAATVDLNDINMIDPFHLEKYNKIAINYNRDIEAFPLLDNILTKILGKKVYYSPTDMGVNMLSVGIENLELAHEYSNKEIIRRYYNTLSDYKLGLVGKSAIAKIDSLISKANIDINERKVVEMANNKLKNSGSNAVAIELEDGTIITGRETKLLSASSACLLNSLKYLAHIHDDIPLISPHILKPILDLKTQNLSGNKNILGLEEVLIALSISATNNPVSHQAFSKLKELKDCEAHSTIIITGNDLKIFKQLEINLTFNDIIDVEDIF